ncbi:MAG: hypothetical protein LQ343_006334 [Gyalolechia ehrenbergii]|nr:MAG: hypothetical protein LQ343_006334 [Gyalolechia ehrenbergii]
MTPESESELSEALDGPNAALSSPTHDADNGVQAAYHPNESGSSHDEDAIGYDDEEYAMDDYAAPTVHPPSHGSRSSSQTSSKLGKRKASVEEDDFMQNDPELYGLRRSNRPRPSRRVVESDSEGSGSDIDTAPRKRRRVTHSTDASKQSTPSSSSRTDSDTETSSRRRSLPRSTTTKRNHRRLVQSAAKKPQHTDVRFSTRQAAKVSNYNEDDDDMFDDEEDMQYEWVEAPDGIIPQVDIILKHRLREDTSTSV